MNQPVHVYVRIPILVAAGIYTWDISSTCDESHSIFFKILRYMHLIISILTIYNIVHSKDHTIYIISHIFFFGFVVTLLVYLFTTHAHCESIGKEVADHKLRIFLKIVCIIYCVYIFIGTVSSVNKHQKVNDKPSLLKELTSVLEIE